MPKPKSAAPLPSGSFKRILSHDEKANFWKPEKIGDKLVGNLLGVTKGKNGKVLQVELFSGEIKQMGVSTQLIRVPWEMYVGHEIMITFRKTVPTQYGKEARLYDVDAQV
jgi:hypothetical protein